MTLAADSATPNNVRTKYWLDDPVTYAGFDRFGRVIQQFWYDYGAPDTRDKYTYGYDRNSNRLYRENNVTGDHKDELYAYDSLNRLTDWKRGNLNGNKDAIATGGDRVRGVDWTGPTTARCRGRATSTAAGAWRPPTAIR